MQGFRLIRNAATAAAFLCLWACSVQAQPVYRVIGADGKPSYSDKPPANAAQVQKVINAGSALANPSDSQLPFELRQILSRFPVVLYTGPDCQPCADGKAMLKNRGIPFAERSVTTNDDALALQRIGGTNMLPQLSIGQQRIKGYSAQEWNETLDAAGYPSSSMLPASYRYAPATPLAPPKASPQPAPEPAAPSRYTPADPGPGPANPAGIRF